MSSIKEPSSDISGRVARIEALVESLAGDLGQHVAQTTASIERLAATTQVALQGQAEQAARSTEQAQASSRELNDSLRKIASETNSSLQALSLKQEQSHRAPWSTLAAWAGVVLAIGGVFGSIVMSRIDMVYSRTDGMAAKSVSDAYDFGRRDAELKFVQAELDRLRSAGKAP